VLCASACPFFEPVLELLRRGVRGNGFTVKYSSDLDKNLIILRPAVGPADTVAAGAVLTGVSAASTAGAPGWACNASAGFIDPVVSLRRCEPSSGFGVGATPEKQRLQGDHRRRKKATGKAKPPALPARMKARHVYCILSLGLLFVPVGCLLHDTHTARVALAAWSRSPDTLASHVVVTEVPVGDYSSRIARFAASAFPSLTTVNAANVACRRGELLLNGETVGGARRVRLNDLVTLAAPLFNLKISEEDCERRARLCNSLANASRHAPSLQVLFEDDHMAIVAKPSGVHSLTWAATLARGTLALDAVLPLLLAPCSHSDRLPSPLPAHRLDARVCGPIVIAKTRRALVALGQSFETRSVAKEYRALVVGRVSQLGRVDSEVGNRAGYAVIESDVGGRSAVTEMRVLGTTECAIDGHVTDLELRPLTGRRHQLREHCAALGHPIVGDDLCSGTARRRIGLFLYCRRVELPHPCRHGEIVSGEIDEPPRFQRYRDRAARGSAWTKAATL
jgi:23S rRNA pseudouridine1911/1915/1917 synthase